MVRETEEAEVKRRKRQKEMVRSVVGQQHRWLREMWPVLALLVVVVGVAAEEIVVALLGGGVFVAGWLARWWGSATLRRLEVRQSLSQTHSFVGETIRYEVRIANRKLLPLPWLDLRTEMPEALRPSGRELVPSGRPKVNWLQRMTSLRWYERLTWAYEIPLTTRGYYRIGPSLLRSGDLFGFFTHERDDPATHKLWVYPEVVSLERLGIPALRPFGETRGGNPLFEDPTRLQALRDYQSGDPLKRVDWKATARRGALFTRVYEPASNPHLLLALNVATLPESWMGAYGGIFERAVSVTASLAAAYGDVRLPLGLIANCTYPDQSATIRVPAGRSDRQALRLLEALAMVDSFALVPMERLLAEEASRLPLGSTVILVTALTSPGLYEALDRLRRRGYGVSVIYVGPNDPDPPPNGLALHDIRPQLESLHFRMMDLGYTWTRATEGSPSGNGAHVGARNGERADGALGNDSLPDQSPGPAAADEPWARPPTGER